MKEQNTKYKFSRSDICLFCINLMLWVCVFLLAICFSDLLLTSKIDNVVKTIETRLYTVTEGDSLWSIVDDASLNDIEEGELVAWMKIANNLDSSCLYAGQRLIIPNI